FLVALSTTSSRRVLIQWPFCPGTDARFTRPSGQRGAGWASRGRLFWPADAPAMSESDRHAPAIVAPKTFRIARATRTALRCDHTSSSLRRITDDYDVPRLCHV